MPPLYAVIGKSAKIKEEVMPKNYTMLGIIVGPYRIRYRTVRDVGEGVGLVSLSHTRSLLAAFFLLNQSPPPKIRDCILTWRRVK